MKIDKHIQKINKIKEKVLNDNYSNSELFKLQVKLFDLSEHIDLIISKRNSDEEPKW